VRIEISLRIAADGAAEGESETRVDETVLVLDKAHDRLEAIGLSLAEGKAMLARVQERIVAAQAGAFAAERRCCSGCGRRLRAKDTGTLRFRTPFGDVRLASPRLRRCSCDPGEVRTVSPLRELFAERIAPEMLYLQTRWASLVSYGVTVDLLRDVLPVAETLNPETVRAQLHRVAERADANLGDEYGAYAEGTPRDWAALPPPEGEIVVGLDGGYVRGREKPGQAGHFEVMVGRSLPEDCDSRYFGFVAAVDKKPRRRLHDLLAEQGLQMNQAITFLTDGGDTVRTMATEVAPLADHVLDWFHITMRLTVLRQYVRGLAHHDGKEAEDLDRQLRRIKGLLWHGNLHEAVPCCEDLALKVLDLESGYASLSALKKAAAEFHTYIANNADAIPNYAERHRYGERVSTAFVEATVNVVVGKRFTKRQQMRWSRRGAHRLLQTRTRTLDGSLRALFAGWHPGMAIGEAPEPEPVLAA